MVLYKSVKAAIRETNRCLFINKWDEKRMQDIKALYKTWMMKELRKQVTYGELTHLTDLKDTTIVLENGQIGKILIHPRWTWTQTRESQLIVKFINDEMDYKELRYTPGYAGWSPGTYMRQVGILEEVQSINYDNLLNFKF